MSTALSHSSRPKKTRAVFERPQPAPSPYLPAMRIPKVAGIHDEKDLKASRSSPFLSLTNGGSPNVLHHQISFPRSPLTERVPSPLELQQTAFLAPPQSPLLQVGPSTSDLFFNGPLSTVSLLADDDLPSSPSSPGLAKDWRAMQVPQPHPLFYNCTIIFWEFCLQQATFTNWVNERLKSKHSNYTGPKITDLV